MSTDIRLHVPYDRHTEMARQAGSDHPPLGIFEPEKCLVCPNRVQGCDLCRDNPEPPQSMVIQRLCAFMIDDLKQIAEHDKDRIRANLPSTSLAFWNMIQEQMEEIDRMQQQLVDLTEPLDAEQVAGEHCVEQVLGGQNDDNQ